MAGRGALKDWELVVNNGDGRASRWAVSRPKHAKLPVGKAPAEGAYAGRSRLAVPGEEELLGLRGYYCATSTVAK